MLSTKYLNTTLNVLRIAVLAVSVGLIVLMSIDVFTKGLDFPYRGLYMRAQLPVCIIFLADFFVGLYAADNRGRYLRRQSLFLLISIPYTWVIAQIDVHPGYTLAYILHFMPTLRAALALAIVVGFVSKNPLIGLFASYASIVLLAVYFSSLIFFIHEGSGVNPDVTSYWASLWWCCLQATTLGASFWAVTTIGKIIAMALSTLGVLMFPLFTVYVTQVVRRLVTVHKASVEKTTQALDKSA